MIQETFDSTRKPLNDILRDIADGKTQLPDFQRGWVWDDERIQGLLASIAVSYPIGAIMLLETGNPDVRFKPRPITGAQNGREPEFFILDGQQRLTTLFQTLATDKVVETVDTKKKSIKRWYYLDIQKAANEQEDIADAIISIPEEKKVTSNFGRTIDRTFVTEEDEFRELVFPVNHILRSTEWFNKYMQYWGYNQEKIQLFQKFQTQVIKRFETYQLPVIKLFKHNPKEAVCQVFEKVNTGGVALNVFELLTATYAADDFNLRDDWANKVKELRKQDVLSGVGSNEILQAIALFASIERKEQQIAQGIPPESLSAVSCKKKDVLKISLDVYLQWSDIAMEAFIKAGRLLFRNKVFKSRDLPYSTQLVPLAVIIGRLGVKAESEGVKQKILKWYWNGVLGELYGGANETRFAKDAVEVVDWINGGDEPTTIRDSYFAEDRLLTLKTRNSAAYKGLYILQMQVGARDFITGVEVEYANYFDDAIDIHHIFPQKWCEDNGISEDVCNSILNKTPLSPRTNRIIGGRAPSQYMEAVRRHSALPEEQIYSILESHKIPVQPLLNDDFDSFIAARKELLLQLIEKATGKSPQRVQIEL
ncbi:GmrSD restriction endonuclease domain-containing protein [Telluribacter sp.]|jgi:hypothetical protein|uniref:GmrSD restriction endonuclease domain-containing protein n=1 Tax=Telluribacter sp. TaxID=1978767 RepID=UPI002E125572|nr:DUF262 domain-containing protein [Telluribacter sp.]